MLNAFRTSLTRWEMYRSMNISTGRSDLRHWYPYYSVVFPIMSFWSCCCVWEQIEYDWTFSTHIKMQSCPTCTLLSYMIQFKHRLPLFILILLFLSHFTVAHPHSFTPLFFHSLTFSSSIKMNEKHWESECVRAQSEATRHLSNLEMARSDIMYVRTVQMNSVQMNSFGHVHVQLPLSSQITSSFSSRYPFLFP